MRRIFCILTVLALILSVAGCGCGNQNIEVDDVFVFLSDAAEKTAAETDSAFNATMFDDFVDEDQNVAMKIDVEVNSAQTEQGNVIVSGSIKSWPKGYDVSAEYEFYKLGEEEELIVMKDMLERGLIYKNFPINIAKSNDLKNCMSPDVEIKRDGEEHYVEFITTYSKIATMGTGILEYADAIRPIRVRLYVNKDGYLSRMECDLSENYDGTGEIYTSEFVYCDFGKNNLEIPEYISPYEYLRTENPEDPSKYPKGADSSTLTLEMLSESKVNHIDYTTENISEYEGKIDTNYAYTIGLNNDGTVMVTDGYFSDCKDFVAEETALWSDIVYVDAAESDVVGVKNDGTVVAAGRHMEDGIWNTTGFFDVIAAQAESDTLYALHSDGTVTATGVNAHVCDGWTDVKKISVDGDSDDVVIALKNDGTVNVFSKYPQIYEAENWTNIVDVSAGRFHVVGLKSDGTVVVANGNPLEGGSRGEDNVSQWEDVVYVAAGNMITVGVTKDGHILYAGEVDQIINWEDVVYVDVGNNVIYSIRDDGRIYAMYRAQEWDING